jgi:probable addiction module antidote protein
MRNKSASKNFYSDFLINELKNIEFAAEYLNAALEEKNEHSFLIAVRNVAKAHSIPMGKLAQKTQINRVNIYKMLSKKGNPLLSNVKRILEALGFKIAITSGLLKN